MTDEMPEPQGLLVPGFRVSMRRTATILCKPRILFFAGMGLLVWLLARTAWTCDDAYITFRTVDNFLHGLGPCWNPPERVQSFTHPLWMLSLTAAVALTHEFYYTSIFLSIILTVAAVAVLTTRLARTPRAAAFAWAILASSTAFVEFGASGLENALSYFLLAMFVLTLFAKQEGVKRLFALSALAALLTLNRMDLALIAAIPLATEFWRIRSRNAFYAVLAGMLPLVAWELFSIIYYGFPFPNTAYAKLGGGITWIALIPHGFEYLNDSLYNDPLTLVACVTAIIFTLLRLERKETSIALGLLAYLIYVVCIGGDFMRGRFLSVPIFASAVLLARSPLRKNVLTIGIAAAVVLGLFATNPPILSGSKFGSDAGAAPPPIRNERLYSYSGVGMLSADRGTTNTTVSRIFLKAQQEGKALSQETKPSPKLALAAGVRPFYAGPNTYFIDLFALCDPLLARLPIKGNGWLIGHLPRILPTGYIETLRDRENKIENPPLHEFYEQLCKITRGPIWSWERFKIIIGMNLGAYSPPQPEDEQAQP